jgi:hypothetical protein
MKTPQDPAVHIVMACAALLVWAVPAKSLNLKMLDNDIKIEHFVAGQFLIVGLLITTFCGLFFRKTPLREWKIPGGLVLSIISISVLLLFTVLHNQLPETAAKSLVRHVPKKNADNTSELHAIDTGLMTPKTKAMISRLSGEMQDKIAACKLQGRESSHGSDFMTAVVLPDVLDALLRARSYKLNRAADFAPFISKQTNKVGSIVNAEKPWFDCTYQRREWSRKEKNWPYRRELTWLNDKIAIKCMVDSIDDQIMFPHVASAYFSDTTAMQQVHRKIQTLYESNESFVVKCSHGANSDCVLPVGPGKKATLETVKKFIKRAADLRVADYDHWLFHHSEPGIVVSHAYDSAIEGFLPPLEIKLLTMWGKVVGGTLHHAPDLAIISANGTLHVWETKQKLSNEKSYTKTGGSRNSADNVHVFRRLQKVLQEDWPKIRKFSERIAQTAGMDELRVDWFLGSPVHGTMLNEITYVGGAQRYGCSMQHLLGLAFVGGYRLRIRDFMNATSFDLATSCRRNMF